VWEYTSMWHKARWPERGNSRYVTREMMKPDGWEKWVISPATPEAPPPNSTEIDALNFMGRLGWELVYVETIVEFPPDVTDKRYAQHHHQYFFKRRLAEA
jgi:hypothetical protein